MTYILADKSELERKTYSFCFDQWHFQLRSFNACFTSLSVCLMQHELFSHVSRFMTFSWLGLPIVFIACPKLQNSFTNSKCKRNFRIRILFPIFLFGVLFLNPFRPFKKLAGKHLRLNGKFEDAHWLIVFCFHHHQTVNSTIECVFIIQMTSLC